MQGISTTGIGIKFAQKHEIKPCRFDADSGITSDTELKFKCLGTSRLNF